MPATAFPSETRLFRERKVTFEALFETRSPAMRRFLDRLTPFVATDRPLVLFGESGTGKTLIAQAVHNASPRCEAPFIAANAADVDDHLFRSEWFGHERNAFTGAAEPHPGHLEAAGKGTLFIDEFTEFPLTLQAKLLRAFDVRELVRVGGTRRIPVECRTIFATNLPREEVVSRPDRWRSDFLSRIGLSHFTLPPLRERMEDLPLLVERFVAAISARDGRSEAPRVADATLRELAERPWRCNLRDLRNTVDTALALCTGGVLLPEHLRGTQDFFSAPPSIRPLRETERMEVERALLACGGNKREAARLLDIAPNTLYRILERSGDDEGGSPRTDRRSDGNQRSSGTPN